MSGTFESEGYYKIFPEDRGGNFDDSRKHEHVPPGARFHQIGISHIVPDGSRSYIPPEVLFAQEIPPLADWDEWSNYTRFDHCADHLRRDEDAREICLEAFCAARGRPGDAAELVDLVEQHGVYSDHDLELSETELEELHRQLEAWGLGPGNVDREWISPWIPRPQNISDPAFWGRLNSTYAPLK